MFRKVLTTVFVQVASYASVLGMYFAVIPPSASRPEFHWIIMGGSGVAVIWLIIDEIREHFALAPRTYKSPEQINKYMCRWISAGGRVAIFSRDMSWAGGQIVQDVLSAKAENNELTIFLEKEIALTNDLKAKGANVITYGKLDYIPKSRFTIVDFDKEGARVAVGVHEHGKHVIQEFRSGAHPFFAVADDMVRFLLKARVNGIS